MANKYMIVVGASVGIVRNGKRVTIAPGGGAEFTEDEVRDITLALPGALRAPVNEGRAAAVVDEDDDSAATAKAAKPAKAAKKPKAKATKDDKASAPAGDGDAAGDADDDEDEDI